MTVKEGVDTERRIRILIIRLSSIGDIVQCSAIPRHLRKRFPHANIDWIVRSDNFELIEHNPYVTQIIPFNRNLGLRGWIELSRKLNQDLYTHVYDAHNNIRSHILCWILQPRILVRRSKNRIRRFFLHWLKISLFGNSYRSPDSFLEPLKAWGVQNDGLGTEVFLDPETYTKTMAVFTDPGKKWIALAPASAWPKKNWPVESWIDLVKMLLDKTDFHLVILGGPKDLFCQELALNPRRVVNLQGKLTLLESAAAVKQCETLVAADTGMLHLSESIGKNVVGLLGPTFFGHPYRKNSLTIQKSLWCQPCSKDGSGPCYNPVYQKCMKMISAEEVFNCVQVVTGPPK